MAKNNSDSYGCLGIIMAIVLFCGLPYSATLIIPLLVIGIIVECICKVTRKKTINTEIKKEELTTTINCEKKNIENINHIDSISQINDKSIKFNEINSKTEKRWKDKYGVEYSNNRQLLEYYSPKINLTEYKVIEGCKIIKRFSFNKELDIDYSECVDIYSYGNNLKTIILPNSIELIEENAFIGCEELQAIIIPNGMIDYFIFICPSMKDYFMEQNERISSISLENNIILTQEIEQYIDKYNFYIQNEHEILFSFYKGIKTKESIYKTTGENEIYKEKLKDVRWLKLSDRIKKRDHYCCQHCFNIQQLGHINDLYSIVDFEEVAANVIETYYQLMNGEYQFETYRMLSFNSNAVYIKRHNIWLTLVEEKGRNILEDANINNYRTSYSIISEIKCNLNDEYVYSHKITMPMRYKAKNGLISYTNKLLIERNMYTKFSSNIFIYHRIDYCNKSHCDFTGRATIFFNEYAITFPLYHLKSHESLNVHHKKYAESGNPWDVHENDLITLCHKCHILEHQETINE